MPKALTFLLLGLISFSFINPIFSQETTEDLKQKIEEYDQKIQQLNKSADTLKNQLALISSQISLTQLKITQTENSIKVLETEIDNLTVKIDKLDVYLNYLSTIFIKQTAESYKLQKRFPNFMILFSDRFNQSMEHYKYIKVLQKSNRDSMLNMETARLNYDQQKREKSLKQAELADLQTKLADQNKNLATQKTSKTSLLEITKNDEVKYQRLKKDAENELATLLAAKFVGKRQVKKGEAIGLMGNTGYSFGDHLHFGVYELKESELSKWSYARDIDPVPYLNQNGYPMSNPTITQGWGRTQYSYLYSDRFHHGYDMVSSNKTINAVNDGIAYFYRNPSSSLGNHVKLFHSDGKMTLYLHMQ